MTFPEKLDMDPLTTAIAAAAKSETSQSLIRAVLLPSAELYGQHLRGILDVRLSQQRARNAQRILEKSSRKLDPNQIGYWPPRVVAVLPVVSWAPSTEASTETCDYSDLNRIRELRNQFIHGIEDPEITSESIMAKQRRYERSMWILRQFASNTQQDVQQLLLPTPTESF